MVPTSSTRGHLTTIATVALSRAHVIAEAIGVDLHEIYQDLDLDLGEDACRECGELMIEAVPDGLCGFCREEMALVP